LENLTIGSATIYDMALQPGTNNITMLGNLDFGTIILNVEDVLNISAPALNAGNLRIWTTGKSTVYHGQHISYYEAILGGLFLQADIPLTDLLVGTLGGFLNSTGPGLQSIVDQIVPLLTSGLIPTSTIASTVQRAYSNGTGSTQDITDALGGLLTSAGSSSLGKLLTSIGSALGAVNDGAATAGSVISGVGSVLGNGAVTITDITNVLNLLALAP
jgi:hypothetical protein